MGRKKEEEMFTLANHITWFLDRCVEGFETKHEIVEKSNGQLFYIFGYKLPNQEHIHDV